MTKIYLAGRIQNNPKKHIWREEAKKVFGKKNCIDPTNKQYDKKPSYKLVKQDLELIDKSDVLVVYYDKPSVGTSMEMFYAKHNLKKPVVLVTKKKDLSPWLCYHCSVICNNLVDAKKIINQLGYKI